MTPPTFRPSTIYIEIDVSGLSLIDAERYFNDLRGVGFPMDCLNRLIEEARQFERMERQAALPLDVVEAE